MSETVIPTGEVHPVAELFPMLPDDELRELADSIAADGLLHPIVIDTEGVLIDGRNRLRACQIAGVEPHYTSLNGHDPVTYILSTNVTRRHMNAGQRAMVRAKAQRSTDGTFHGLQSQLAQEVDAPKSRIAEAMAVMEYRPDLADEVIAGIRGLNDAYARARARKEGQDTDEARLDELRKNMPSLVLEVVEERLTLSAAWAAYQQQRADEARERREVTQTYVKAITSLWGILPDNDDMIVSHWDPEANAMAGVAPLRHLWTADGVRTVAARLRRLAAEIDAQGGSLA